VGVPISASIFPWISLRSSVAIHFFQKYSSSQMLMTRNSSGLSLLCSVSPEMYPACFEA